MANQGKQYQLIHMTDDCDGHYTEKVELVATKAACTALLYMRATRQPGKPEVDISADRTYAGWVTDQDIVHEYRVLPV